MKLSETAPRLKGNFPWTIDSAVREEHFLISGLINLVFVGIMKLVIVCSAKYTSLIGARTLLNMSPNTRPDPAHRLSLSHLSLLLPTLQAFVSASLRTGCNYLRIPGLRGRKSKIYTLTNYDDSSASVFSKILAFCREGLPGPWCWWKTHANNLCPSPQTQ